MNVFNKDEHIQVYLIERSASFIKNIVISKEEGLLKLLKSLNLAKTLRPDELHPRHERTCQ